MDLTPFHGPPATAPVVPGFAARTLLGFGTHGEVWLADDLSAGGPVALKIGRRRSGTDPAGLPPDPPSGPDRETALLCRIDHPHIVRLQRVVPLPAGGVALVLDLASGGSLASLVAARGRFDPGEVSTLLVPLADALDHLHQRGVVHGDIAPGNILFTGDGRPQLGDLGVARMLGTRVEERWATPGFADPAASGPGADRFDARAADLWGLAAIGWFALTGRPPAAGGVGVTAPPAGAGPAPGLEELLARCLTAEPGRRPSLPDLAEAVWQAARPTPVRLVGARKPSGDAGLPPLSGLVTRRAEPVVSPEPGPGAAGAVAAAGAKGGAEGGPGGEGRRGLVERWRSGAAVALAGACVGATVVAVTGVLSVGGPPAGSTDRSSTDRNVAVGSSGVESRAVGGSTVGSSGAAENSAGRTAVASAPPGRGAVPGPTPDDGGPQLRAELTRALGEIGRSRSRAFEKASAGYLLRADVAGSDAYLADLRLVKRLRAEGYRLAGVRYDLAEVRVVHRRGSSVDVRALVTTSRHRQVRLAPGAAKEGVEVPPDGPRPVVFTIAPVDLNIGGPGRWRISDVRVES